MQLIAESCVKLPQMDNQIKNEIDYLNELFSVIQKMFPGKAVSRSWSIYECTMNIIIKLINNKKNILISCCVINQCLSSFEMIYGFVLYLVFEDIYICNIECETFEDVFLGLNYLFKEFDK